MAGAATANTELDLKNVIRTRYGQEPSWMLERRLAAVDEFLGLDWPKLERTPLKKRKLDDVPLFDPIPAPNTEGPPASAPIEIRLDNNHLTHNSLPASLAEAGVILEPMAQALVRESAKLSLAALSVGPRDKIDALNDAAWQNGFFLWVPPNLREPLEISVRHHADATVRSLITKNLIVCGTNSRVVVTERLSSDEGPERMLLSEVTDILVHPGGDVEFDAIQQCAPNADGFVRRHGQVLRDGSLDWNIGEFGAGLVVSSHDSQLSEPGAATRSITVFFGSRQQHQDYTAKSYHQAPHTVSNMVARGVMKDRARSVFTGLTQIDRGARGSDGRQREQTLMLSDDSRADAIPSLVIDERDVFAAHAASAGPVDKAALFYLTSRGLTEQEATRMIVHGFLAPVIDTIPHAGLREEVWAAVERKIRE